MGTDFKRKRQFYLGFVLLSLAITTANLIWVEGHQERPGYVAAILQAGIGGSLVALVIETVKWKYQPARVGFFGVITSLAAALFFLDATLQGSYENYSPVVESGFYFALFTAIACGVIASKVMAIILTLFLFGVTASAVGFGNLPPAYELRLVLLAAQAVLLVSLGVGAYWLREYLHSGGRPIQGVITGTRCRGGIIKFWVETSEYGTLPLRTPKELFVSAGLEAGKKVEVSEYIICQCQNGSRDKIYILAQKLFAKNSE